MPLKRDLSEGEKASVGKDEVIILAEEAGKFVLQVLAEMLLFALAFRRKCHTELLRHGGPFGGHGPGLPLLGGPTRWIHTKKRKKKKHPRRHVHSYMNTHVFFHLLSGTHAGTRTSDDEGQAVGITSRGIYFKNLLTAGSPSAEFPPYWRNSVTECTTMCFYCSGMEEKE